MKATYRVLAYLVAVGVFAQAAFIAYGWFATLHDLDNGAVIDKDYDGNIGHALHGMTGMMVIPAIAIILFIVSFFAKVESGVKWAGFVLLAVIVQVALAFIGFGVPALGFLHGINALIILGLALNTARRVETARVVEPEDRVVVAG